MGIVSFAAGTAIVLTQAVFCDTVDQADRFAVNHESIKELVLERNELNQPVCGVIPKGKSIEFIAMYTVKETAEHYVTYVTYKAGDGTEAIGYLISGVLVTEYAENKKRMFKPRINS